MNVRHKLNCTFGFFLPSINKYFCAWAKKTRQMKIFYISFQVKLVNRFENSLPPFYELLLFLLNFISKLYCVSTSIIIVISERHSVKLKILYFINGIVCVYWSCICTMYGECCIFPFGIAHRKKKNDKKKKHNNACMSEVHERDLNCSYLTALECISHNCHFYVTFCSHTEQHMSLHFFQRVFVCLPLNVS